MKFEFPKNPLVISAAALAIIASVSSFGRLQYLPDAIAWMGDSSNPSPLATQIYVAQVILSVLLTVGLVFLVLFVQKRAVLVSVFGAIAFLGLPANIVADAMWDTADHGQYSLLSTLWNVGGIQSWTANYSFVSQYLTLIALGLVLMSSLVKPREVAAATPASDNRFDPETGLPVASAQAAQPVATGGADSSLPLVALILAFFIPLGAVIVGHIAMNQMNQGLISSQNRGMAKAGLFLGYVFIGLSMLLGLIFGIVYFAMLQRSYY